jgi:hypothetical protein
MPIRLYFFLPASLLFCLFSQGVTAGPKVPSYSEQQYQDMMGINQIYMAPDGRDSGDCDRNNPCKTFDYAVSEMKPGDALILLPGYYALAKNGSLSAATPNGRPIRLSAQPPTGLSAEKPTVVRAEEPGKVEVEGGFTLGTPAEKVKYVVVYGITFLSEGTLRNADFSVVKNTGIKGSLGVGTNDHSEGCMYNLIEDVWIWGRNHRGNAVNYRAHHNTWRRVLVRDDGCDEPYCGEKRGNYSVATTIYNSHDVIFENVIVFDRIMGNNPHGYADYATAQHDSSRQGLPEGEANGRNQWLGCMSINSEDAAINFEADETLDFPETTGTIKDFVALKSRQGLSLDGAHRPYKGNSYFEMDNLNLYTTQTGGFYIGCDIVNRGKDKGCAHLKNRINKGLYKPGMSALLPQNRYGTQQALWPWPNESRIKNDICKNDGYPRGWCQTEHSLTEYLKSF